MTTRTLQLPFTLHGAIGLSVSTPTAVATATADASIAEIDSDGDLLFDFITNTIGPLTKTATASVAPATLAATSPTAIPTTGYYLTDIDSEPYQFDRVRVFAEVVNFAYFA